MRDGISTRQLRGITPERHHNAHNAKPVTHLPSMFFLEFQLILDLVDEKMGVGSGHGRSLAMRGWILFTAKDTLHGYFISTIQSSRTDSDKDTLTDPPRDWEELHILATRIHFQVSRLNGNLESPPAVHLVQGKLIIL